MYEKITASGYSFDEATSALQKSIRRGEEEAAVFWAQELESRFYKYLWKRLVIISHEDIGVNNLDVIQFVETCRQQYFWLLSEGIFESMLVINAVVAMCRARNKTRVADHLWTIVYGDAQYRREVPDYALDMHTARGRAEGRGRTTEEGQNHWFEEAEVLSNEDSSPYHERYRQLCYQGHTVRSWVTQRERKVRSGKGGDDEDDNPVQGQLI